MHLTTSLAFVFTVNPSGWGGRRGRRRVVVDEIQLTVPSDGAPETCLRGMPDGSLSQSCTHTHTYTVQSSPNTLRWKHFNKGNKDKVSQSWAAFTER